jgi:rRNA-processing protein CGR1
MPSKRQREETVTTDSVVVEPAPEGKRAALASSAEATSPDLPSARRPTLVADAAERARKVFLESQRARAAASVSAESEEPGSRPATARVGVKPWKRSQKTRSSAATRSANSNANLARWRMQQAAKASRELHKDIESQRLEELREKREAERLRREAKEKRRAENELKGTTYQVLKNPETIKKMNKKQLRQVKKTQVNKHGVTELVSPWGASSGGSS